MKKSDNLVEIRIKKNAEWRGAKYFEHAYFSLSTEYAKHVVETLGVAEYMTDEMRKLRALGKD